MAVHAAALVRSLGIVGDEIGVESGLHFLDGLEPGAAAFDAEVLVEQGAVEALDDAVGLRSADLGLAVLDAFELEEQLVGMAVGAATELAAALRTVLIGMPWASKVGSTSVLSRWTAVSGILLV